MLLCIVSVFWEEMVKNCYLCQSYMISNKFCYTIPITVFSQSSLIWSNKTHRYCFLGQTLTFTMLFKETQNLTFHYDLEFYQNLPHGLDSYFFCFFLKFKLYCFDQWLTDHCDFMLHWTYDVHLFIRLQEIESNHNIG